jgi:hypothetical protein
MSTPDIRIVAPADPGDAVFDEHVTPFLQFGQHPEHGEGWTLSYLTEDGSPMITSSLARSPMADGR